MTDVAPLPGTFVPGNKDVVICKGKQFFNHGGNARLRKIATSMLGEYEAARSKLGKSVIISTVVARIREEGSFVKRDLSSGKWVFAEDLLCREKTSASFRDALQQRRRKKNLAACQSAIRERNILKPERRKCMPQTSETVSNERAFMNFSNEEHVRSSRKPTTSTPLGNKLGTWNPSDTFSGLCNAFSNVEEDGNPFEPTPLAYETYSFG